VDMTPYSGSLRIGGEAVESAAGTYDVVSPVTGGLVATHPRMTSDTVHLAVRAARAAYEANLNRSAFERADWCYAIADVIVSRASQLASLLSLEHGKPIAEAEGELHSAAEGFRLAAEEARRLGGDVPPVRDASKLVIVRRRPCGVFAVITPFNFPVNIPVEYLGPVIANGNAVVWKPSPSTTTIAAALYDCIAEAGVPAGLVNLITGPDVEPVQVLVAHPDVVGVGFTGGPRTGAEISRLAAGKPQLMELGGNGPLIVLQHADPQVAATAASAASFANAGQSCAAAGRILVAESIYDAFLDALVTAASQERLGDPFDSQTTMGPVHTQAVAATMRAHLGDASSRGAVVVSGGEPATGFPTDLYWPPTIVAGLPGDSLTLAEETFGPLAAVQRVPDDVDALLAVANAGTFGLSGAVFGTSLDETIAVASRLQVGQVTINDTSNYWELHMPFGGAAGRDSGIGRLGGRYVAEHVTQVQSISVTLKTDWRS